MASEEVEKQIERLRAMFPKISPRVLVVLIRRFRIPREWAEDVVQDVFATLIAQVRRGERKEVLLKGDDEWITNYVMKAAVHRYVDVFRHVGQSREKEQVLYQVLEPGGSPEMRAASEEEIEHLRFALTQLREPYVRIFELLLDEELSLAEIARRLGTNPGSIYTQFQRGLTRLRKLMKPHVRGSKSQPEGHDQ